MEESSGPSKIRVLIVDDHTLFAEGLMSLFADDGRIEVVGHAANGALAVELVEDLRPTLVLMDVQMPGMDGIDATRRIKEIAPDAAILILTASASEDVVQRATAAGASGYLTKSAAASELVSTVLELAAFATLPTTAGASVAHGRGR